MTEAKKKVLNAAVVIYVCLCHLRSKKPGDMDPYSFYQPNVMEKMLKHIFKCLNDSSVMFQQSDFQGMAGGYHALIDEYYDMVSAGKKSVFSTIMAGAHCSIFFSNFYYKQYN